MSYLVDPERICEPHPEVEPRDNHLVLDWVHNADTQELICTIDNELMYQAYNGGYDGFTKTYKGKETTVTYRQWEDTEKYWISENYGETVGYFQPDDTRQAIEPRTGELEGRMNGFGPNGEYLDHMARSQLQLNGDDMAIITSATFGIPSSDSPAPLFWTPDRGLTIYKTLPTDKTFYEGDGTWQMVPQPCMMQPYSVGRILSDYEELELAGCPKYVIEKCKAGEWLEPEAPEYQKNFVYATVNAFPLTEDNINNIWEGNASE